MGARVPLAIALPLLIALVVLWTTREPKLEDLPTFRVQLIEGDREGRSYDTRIPESVVGSLEEVGFANATMADEVLIRLERSTEATLELGVFQLSIELQGLSPTRLWVDLPAKRFSSKVMFKESSALMIKIDEETALVLEHLR